MPKARSSLVVLIFVGMIVMLISVIANWTVAPASASTNVSGRITTNTTWTVAVSPYIVVGDVIVDANVFLTIEPGVVVKFTAGTNLVIDGSLIAQGNSTHKITFTSNATAPAPGDWGDIRMRSPALCDVTNSVIEYATTGLNFENLGTLSILMNSRVMLNIVGIRVYGYNVVMNELTIERNTDCGIYVIGGTLEIQNSLISNNNIGIKGSFGSINTINNCTISNNTYDGIYSDGTPITDLLDSDIVDNGGRGISTNRFLLNCRNTVVSNNSGGGVYVSYQFAKIYDCIITKNNGHGVWSDGVWSDAYGSGIDITLSGSIVSNNSITGVSGGRVNIEFTTIIDNSNVGVSAYGGKIHFSNIYYNGLYEVKSTGIDRWNPSQALDAIHNWWSTTNGTLIRERIYDYYDEPSLSVVSYVPFLNSSKATLTIFTSGVSSAEPVGVRKDGMEVGLVHDGKPLNITVYSGYTQSRMGTFSLSIDDTRIWDSNPDARYKFVNWTGPAGSGISNSITLAVTADSSITAFYKAQYLTNFTFKDSSRTVTLYVEPSKIQTIAPNGSLTMLTSFLNQWLDEGTWTIKQIQWQGNNVKPSIDPTYSSTPGGTWAINCRVYLISFSNSFKDSDGNDLYTLPSSFKLTFPNGTTSTFLNSNSSYYIQNGTTTWSSIIWQDTEVCPSNISFDPTNGNPSVNCEVYSLTVDPFFYDNTGTTIIQPSLWSIEFPNGTIRTVSSSVTYNQTQIGEYSIVSIIWEGVEVFPETTPTTLLASDMVWSPGINCLLPTSMIISLSSSTSYVGFKVGITGNLTYNEVGLSGAPILLSYSVTGGESWSNITLVNTASDGGYSAVWMPSATGNYLVRATWSGNATYPRAAAIINLAVTPYREQNVFSVTSNSTISELTFNSTSRELSFTVTGPTGTTGYINVYIAKTLIDNIANLKVYLDGASLDYTATSMDDSWLLHLTYMHSTHKVTISLGSISTPLIEITSLEALIGGILIAGVSIFIIFFKRRQILGRLRRPTDN